MTFVASMLERVIEEQARGDLTKAQDIRVALTAIIGDNLAQLKPGQRRCRAGQGRTHQAWGMVAVP